MIINAHSFMKSMVAMVIQYSYYDSCRDYIVRGCAIHYDT